MKISKTKFDDILTIHPNIYSDERGFFLESFNEKWLSKYLGNNIKFVQDNISFSKRGVLRGLHYQESPMEQGKLVSVINGAVHDVAVDIRKNSSSYGKWVMEKLTSKNKRQLWIPPGFAHGFYSLNEETTVLYKTTNLTYREYPPACSRTCPFGCFKPCPHEDPTYTPTSTTTISMPLSLSNMHDMRPGTWRNCPEKIIFIVDCTQSQQGRGSKPYLHYHQGRHKSRKYQ